MTEYIYDTSRVETQPEQGFTGETVVRCRDCKFYNDSDAGCNLFVLAEHKLLHVHNPDGFCSYAERREK